MANLLIDSGNTFTKAAISQQGKIVKIAPITTAEDLAILVSEYTISRAILSSVNSKSNEWQQALGSVDLLMLSHHTPLPIRNLYSTPATLGMDRLASAVGAYSLFPNQTCLCIDAGTCITYDLLDASGAYHGGAITPGLEIRYKALHTFTARLPLIHQQADSPLVGTSTETSILSGVQNGIVYEMEGMINAFRQKHGALTTLLTGGDSLFFESRIKEPIFVSPDLVFVGLNRIIEHNAS